MNNIIYLDKPMFLHSSCWIITGGNQIEEFQIEFTNEVNAWKFYIENSPKDVIQCPLCNKHY